MIGRSRIVVDCLPIETRELKGEPRHCSSRSCRPTRAPADSSRLTRPFPGLVIKHERPKEAWSWAFPGRDA